MNALLYKKTSRGFTLVELLVVITVIGIIAGLAIPAIGMALRAAQKAKLKAETNLIAQGIESYKTQYDDYPPDFSDWSLVERHYRKIFPDIQQSELTLLFRLGDATVDTDPNQVNQGISAANWGAGIAYNNGGNPEGTGLCVIDRAEAVVWNLGGFSSNKQKPFTGTGGPLQYIGPTPPSGTDLVNPLFYQYNPTRNKPLMDFEPARLTFESFDSANPISVTNRNVSTDEPPATLGIPNNLASFPDIFPTYVFDEEESPFVYFDSRTYIQPLNAASPQITNVYVRFIDGLDDPDVVRPLYGENPNPSPGTAYGTVVRAAHAWGFVNPQSFQILTPGIFGRYGSLGDADGLATGGLHPVSNPTNGFPLYFQYATGRALVLNPAGTDPNSLYRGGIDRYDISAPFPQLENEFGSNMGNFSDGELINSVP